MVAAMTDPATERLPFIREGEGQIPHPADPWRRGGNYGVEMASLDAAAEALVMPKRSVLVREVVLIALGIGLAWFGAIAATEAAEDSVIELGSATVTMGLIVPSLILLLARRRFPISVMGVLIVLFSIIRWNFIPEFQVSSIAFVIGFYAVGRYGRPVWRDWVRGFSMLVIAVLILKEYSVVHENIAELGLGERYLTLNFVVAGAWNLVLFVVAWIAGELSRKRVERDRELAARTIELEASREENARRAVMDERVRIAREIHDVVAHHVSVMGVQAGAARRILSVDPDAAEQPLRAIETSSREAVTELHRLLGFLRRADEPDPNSAFGDALMPAPGLARLPDLRSQLAEAGLAMRLTVTGEERPLPPSVDLNAYRILQEALTNCLKYAGVDVADVSVDYRDDSLCIRVTDTGRGLDASHADVGAKVGGAGLIGMAERVALLGGSLRHGARDGGGFEVIAELPYAGLVEAAPAMTPPVASPTTPPSNASATGAMS